MAAQQGRAVLVKVASGPGVFAAVAGLRARAIQLSAVGADATNADSEGAWREILGGAGVKAASVTGAGIFKDAASDALLRTAFWNGATPDFQIVVPDFGTIEGPFHIAALEYAGTHDGAATFSMTLNSAGALGFTAAS
ncbi:MAG: phage major tail protein, TP901-1 family [Alphaproteobacteria bacterium]|nr:phage major tail protein, TP901-1 family [Alphaproteobacteria bacterium]